MTEENTSHIKVRIDTDLKDRVVYGLALDNKTQTDLVISAFKHYDATGELPNARNSRGGWFDTLTNFLQVKVL